MTFSGVGSTDANTVGNEAVLISGRNFGPRMDSFVNISYSTEIAVRDPTTGAIIGTEVYTFLPTLGDCTMGYEHVQLLCKTAPGAGDVLVWVLTVSSQASRTPTTDYHPSSRPSPCTTGQAWG